MAINAAEGDVDLTLTGAGTPMGELLRRYWHPVAAVTEFETSSTKSVRLLGEDLVVYRDLSGTWGLLERHCPHRRADMSYGFVEECGIRCSYHGWGFDEQGNCFSQPFEDSQKSNTRFRDSVKIRAYRIAELAGLLFAYLGPEPAPLVPNWEPFTYENGFRQIVFSDIDCNWLQCAENNLDPVHFEWLHSNWSAVRRGRRDQFAAAHRKIDVTEFEYGLAYHRMVEGEDETALNWRTWRLSLLPNVFLPQTHFEWRVPVDDHHTLSVVWAYQRVPIESEPYHQERIPHWYSPAVDAATGRYITSHVINQDTVAWVGQGAVSDRENEHLGSSDLGVRMLRAQLLEDVAAVQRGEDPKGLVRDPVANECIALPERRFELLAPRLTREEFRRRFLSPDRDNPDDYFHLLAGQPDEVRRLYEEAMGL